MSVEQLPGTVITGDEDASTVDVDVRIDSGQQLVGVVLGRERVCPAPERPVNTSILLVLISHKKQAFCFETCYCG